MRKKTVRKIYAFLFNFFSFGFFGFFSGKVNKNTQKTRELVVPTNQPKTTEREKGEKKKQMTTLLPSSEPR